MSIKRRYGPHRRVHREDKYILGVIYSRPGMTTRELCEVAGTDYVNNGNKRARRWAKRLRRWVRTSEDRPFRWWPKKPMTPTQVKADWQRRKDLGCL